MTGRFESWGRAIASTPAAVVEPPWIPSRLPENDLLLAHGLGRSYGDVCLNNGHTLIATRRFDHVVRFDETEGLLECEAGMSLDAVLQLVVPRGWFPAVTPGTRHVTIGGCIANDVHGKNHHRAGTFGRFVRSFELLRSDGSLVRCSPAENAELFAATIGGLGLTGLIATATIALRRIPSAFMTVERIPFTSLAELEQLDAGYEYTAAWFDSFGGRTPRGIFFRANHAETDRPAPPPRRGRRLPARLLAPLLAPAAIRLFNAAYFRANARPRPELVPFDPFFYPLDAIEGWNAMYGAGGLLQYQCVIPSEAVLEPVGEILARAARTRAASFLTVLKKFGSIASPGILSFPRAGTTIALDFPATDSAVRLLLGDFDAIVGAAGGAVYPAKDARMPPAAFRQFFPRWEELARWADPRFSSSFWRRVTA